jgi:hypothetical protein
MNCTLGWEEQHRLEFWDSLDGESRKEYVSVHPDRPTKEVEKLNDVDSF